MTLIPNDYQKEINKIFEISKKEIDALKAENKELNEQLRLHSVSNSIATEKTNDISSCDCFVGFLSGEKINKSTIDYEVKRISDIQPKFKEYGLLNGDTLSPRQIVDNRRGYLSRFAYCPYCGEKINWKQVLSNCL